MNNNKRNQKKIAILSMQRVVNFGSVLQAYSLREILREITQEQVAFLDVERDRVIPVNKSVPESVDYEAPAAYPSGLAQRAKRWIIARLSSWNKYLIRKFMQEELGLTEEANHSQYDCVVVGSDEVFNHAKGLNLQLHGGIKQAKRIISYGASCGNAAIEDIAQENVGQVKAAMRRFSAISVRDEATERYVAALYDGGTQRHLDPVLVGDLHRRNHRPVGLSGYVLVYAYGQRIRTAEEIRAIREFAKAKRLKTVAMGGSQFWCDMYIPADPFRLLDYFYHADYVVTDTFHGVIFSVINRKQFAVIMRKTNHNKIRSLLEDLFLQDRLVTDICRMETTLLEHIDYDTVGEILERERIRTREYLKKQLEG